MALRAQGFQVQRVGRRHLTVVADLPLFVRMLGVMPRVGSHVEIPESGGELSPLFSAVEVASAPAIFASSR